MASRCRIFCKKVISQGHQDKNMKVAIIGCGFVSEGHIACLKRLSDIEIVGVADTDKVAAGRIADKFDIPQIFPDTASLLKATSPEVVHLLTPPQTHAELALMAMESDCHVLLEKPMAPTAAEARAILAGARENEVALSICHNFLFMPCVVAARKMLVDGAIGELVSVDIAWRPPNRGFHVGWTKDLPGGAMHEIVPHAVYLQRAFVGELTGIAGISRRGGDARGPDCEIHILLDAESGSSHIGISPTAEPKQFLMRVEGTKMSLQIDLSANTLVKIRKLGDGKIWKAVMNIDQAAQLLTGTFGSALSVLRSDICNGHFPLIEAFYRSLREGGELPVTGEDGVETVAALDKIWSTPSA
jgi:predicted dehydrogenase